MKRLSSRIRWSHVALALLVGAMFLSLGGAYYQQQGNSWQQREKKKKEILAKIPTQPDILINITWDLMPGTPELTALGRKATKALVHGLLDNASDGIRSTCAGVLAQIRDPDAAPALVEALNDRNDGVRQQAVVGLGNLADPAYGKHFVRLLEDPEESHWVKQYAVEAIGKVGYTRAVSKLEKILKSKNQRLSWHIIAALWHMRNKADRGDLEDIFLYVLKEEKGGAAQVIDYLGELKADDASDILARYYVGRDDNMKNRIILAMGKIGDSRARRFLKAVLQDTQVARHLNNAAIALADLGERKETIDILLTLLQDRKAYMRINASFALGEIKATEERAVQGLVSALKDRNDYVRSEAAVALGRIKATAATAQLEALANGDNPFVALDAVIALNRIDYQKYRQLIFDKLLVHTKPAFRRIRERGIRFLAEQKDPAALPYLLKDLRTNNAGVLQTALRQLRDFDQKNVTDEFEPSLRYLTHTCSYACFSELLRTLREWKLEQFTAPLLERLYRVYYGNEKTLIYFTLGKIATPDVTQKLAAIEEQSHTPRMYQQFALANLGDQQAAEKLIDIVQEGTLNDKRDAAFLLAALESQAIIPRLEKLMQKADPFTAVTAAGALMGQGHDGAYKYLYKVMKEGTPVIADEAARFFLITSVEDIEKFLEKRVDDEKDIVTKRRVEELLYMRKPTEFR